jgi:ATP-binding cassette subfamily B (MDR/TAP) protein 1
VSFITPTNIERTADELTFITRYDDKLNQARRLGAKKGFSVGVALGFIFFFLFGTYSIGFGFGGYLIAEQGAQGGDILTVFFSVIIGAFSLGQAAPNIETLLTAAGSATTVYKTIDRTPPIDSSSEAGLKPEKLNPTIELRNVNFTYPTRPDVQVSQ